MVDTFGQLLRRFRARAGLNVSELAEALGASRVSIAAWEADARVPRDRARVLDLAQVLQLTPSEADQLAAAARGHKLTPDRAAAGEGTISESPALMTMRHQLRLPVADFVGREQEMAQLVTRLRAAATLEGRAVISGVRGMGGIGKTELAYRVAHQLRAAFPDAQIVLDMRGSSAAPLGAEQALQAVIRAFTPTAKLSDDLQTLQQLYRSVLHDQRALILADDACDAAQVRPLLPPPGCALLITSRQRFSLPGMVAIDLDQLNEEEAVALLRAICGRLSMAAAQAIARACGYLPLALRIGGGILHNDPAVPVAGYIARLADERQRLSQLRDPDDVQLDVEASLALSYALLDDPAQRVFRQIGVLQGDFATPLALAVLETDAGDDVEALLRRLLRRNMLQYDLDRARWRLHNLVRALALRRLEAASEAEAVSWRYMRCAVRLAHEIQDQYLAGGEGILAALTRFDTERPHIDAIWRWAAAQAGTPIADALLLEAAVATRAIGELRDDMRHERIPQLERALAAARRLGDQRSEGQLLINLGNAFAQIGDARRAIPCYEQGRAIAHAIGDQRFEAIASNNLGNAYYALGDARRAIPCYEQGRAIAHAIGDQRLEGITLLNLGNAATALGDIRQAIPYYQQRLAIARAIGDRRGEGLALGNLGNAYRDLGEAQQAIDTCEQAIIIAQALGDRHTESVVLTNLGLTYAKSGAPALAIEASERALDLARAVGDRRVEGVALTNLCYAYAELGDAVRASDIGAQALEVVREVGDRRQEGYALSALGRAAASLGDIPRATAAFEQALAILHEVGDRSGAAASSWHFGLTLARQQERERALLLLRACVRYEEEIGHMHAADHAVLLEHLAAGGKVCFPHHQAIDRRR